MTLCESVSGIRFNVFFFFFWFPTVYSQGFQSKTNNCSRRVGPQRGKALAPEVLFKVQVVGLELGSTPSRAQYKHLETESPTNSANPLGWIETITTLVSGSKLLVKVIYKLSNSS